MSYSYGDFKHDPVKVLARYFDIFTYEANWGSQRIAFRFDADDADEAMLALFTHSDVVKVGRTGSSIIVEAGWWEENYRESSWISDESGYGRFHQLYRDILAGDFRAPFILWLKSSAHCEADPENPSAPVPSGLSDLGADYEDLIELIAIEQDLIDTAAGLPATLDKPTKPSAGLDDALEKMEPARMREYLARYLAGDTRETTRKLKAELRTLLPPPEKPRLPDKTGFVPFSEIAAREQAIIRAREQRLAEEEEKRNAAYLARLEDIEGKIWQAVDDLVSKKLPKAYDQAVEYLGGLRHLYKHRDQPDTFVGKVREILTRYPTLIGLRQRVERADLLSAGSEVTKNPSPTFGSWNKKNTEIDFSEL